MFTNAKTALAAALALGAASAALGNDSGENHQDEDRSVVSSSVARVNPSSANPHTSYGFAVPTQLESRKKDNNY
jgi:hypothetical protein